MINRRQLLHATGLAAGGLSLPSLFGERKAHAAQATRLVIFFTQHGPGYENWKMRRPGLPDKDKDWEFSLETAAESEWSTVLKPLYAQRKNILVLDGLAMTSAIADSPGTNNHNAGQSHILTGAKLARKAGFNNEGNGGAASVDQIVANAVVVPGRIKSLFYSSAFQPWSPSFTGPNVPTTAEFSPVNGFNRLFPPGFAPKPGAPTEADLIRAARPNILDLLQPQYGELAKQLGSEDRKKLEQHRQLIADLGLQIKARASSTTNCTAPTKPTLTNDGGGGGNKPALTKAFMNLVTAAMGCDLTRVALIVSGQLSSSDFGGPAGDVHQDIAHQAMPGTAAGAHMGNYYKTHAAEFASLISQFQSAGLLQDTAMLWVNELSNGPHDLYKVMMVLAGGAGGAFRTGRYLKYAETNPNPVGGVSGGGGCQDLLGPAHNQVLVSIMQAMGLPRTSIGMESSPACFGGVRNTVTSLTGPLPRLM